MFHLCLLRSRESPICAPAPGDGSLCQGPCLFGFFSSLPHLTEICLTVQRHSFSPQDSPSDKMSSWLCFPAAQWLAQHCPPDSQQHSGRELHMLAAQTSVFLMKFFECSIEFFLWFLKSFSLQSNLYLKPRLIGKHACGNISSKWYYVASCMFCITFKVKYQ